MAVATQKIRAGGVKRIYYNPEPFQVPFVWATNRFPGMIAGWGTGKTMWALIKGMNLSQEYDNNLGVIVRSKYTDLRDSTMKDFHRYTENRIPIPQGTKEARIGNSTILFRHAKELSGLQNVNLGWFYIEQAEEFPTATQFDLLRGRLRRILTPKPEVQEKLIKVISEHTGLPALREVVDDWQFLDEKAVDRDGNHILHPELKDNPAIKEKDKYMKERDVAELALVEQLDITLRQGMVIANANGHNWCWKMFIKSPQRGYTCVQATGFDNAHNLPADTLADWATMEINSPAKYKQYVMNCHDEVDLDACYYIALMNQLRANDHICHVPHDPSVSVYVSFDIGLDCTAMWFRQTVRGQKRLIDYYENTGKFVDHYDTVMKSKPYSYSKLILPHDGKNRDKVSGVSYKKALEDLEYKVVVNKKIGKDIGINIVADALQSYYIDEEKCKDGIEALDHYRREYDEENRIYKETPLHDWASHPCDSLKEMCQADKAGQLGSSSSVSTAQISKWQKQYSRTG